MRPAGKPGAAVTRRPSLRYQKNLYWSSTPKVRGGVSG